MFYWTTIPKNKTTYHPSRGVREQEIAKVIQDEVVINKDLNAAEKKLLATDGLRRFSNGLKTDKQREDFRRHLRRYLQIYLPDCPWEVNTTNRYTIVTHEAAVTARQSIKRNESIKYLSGIQVVITPEEEKEMAIRKKDFSLVVSSRSKSTSLFMGPARFANHDCGANAKLMTTGQAGIEIVATRSIEPGEEITVTYGESYFGEDNCECLCKTCEDHLRNGWESAEGAVMVKKSIEEEKFDGYSLRRRRQDDSSSRTPSVTPDIRPRVLKRKKSSIFSQARDSTVTDTPGPEPSPRGRKRQRCEATPPVTPAKKPKHVIDMKPAKLPASRDSSASGRASESASNTDLVETDVTTPEGDSPEPVLETPMKREESDQGRIQAMASVAPLSPQSADEVSPQKREARDIVTATPSRLASMSITAILNAPSPSEIEAVASLTVSIETVEESQVAEPESDELASKRRKYKRRIYVKQGTPPVRVRVPGDYLLTPLLLSEPEMAWIQCTNCPTCFVQQNAYYTKTNCPRCERHSKLYGYVWPKTDKEGARDKEERVLDHRLIHRFLDPDDERRVRGKKGLLSKSGTEDTEQEEPNRQTRVKRQSSTGTPQKVVEEDLSGLRRSGRARRISSRLAEL